MITLTGPKVRLRALELSDIDLLYEWENDCSIWMLSNTTAPVSRFVLEQYLLNAHQDIYTTKQLRLMIEAQTGRKYIPVGLIDLFDFDPNHLRAGIGVLIVEKFRRRGFAAEALGLLVDYCFEVLNLHQIFCHVNVSNTASLRLFKSKGFQNSGRLKQWHRGENSWSDVFVLQLINA